MGAVWGLDLPHSWQSVLLALADHADHTGGSVFPSTGLIAWKTGYSRRQVQRIIDALERVGLLVRVADARAHRATEFEIHLDAAAAKTPYVPEKRSDRMSPHTGRRDVTPQTRQDVTPTAGRMSPLEVTSEHARGDIAVSPKPPVEPSVEPSSPPPPAPRGSRQRDRERYEEKLDGWINEHFPGLLHDATPTFARSAVSQAARAGCGDPDCVRRHLAQHFEHFGITAITTTDPHVAIDQLADLPDALREREWGRLEKELAAR
jgi:hypothetical protein